MAKRCFLFRCFASCLVCFGWLAGVCLFLHFEVLMVLWFVFFGVWESCKCV